jgi:hypothetical protein
MISFDLRGTAQFADKLDKLADKIGKENVEPIVLAGADKLRKYIRKAAPRGKTGDLQRGQIRKLLPRNSAYPVVALIRPQYSIAPHSHLIEFGHATVQGGKLARTDSMARKMAARGESIGEVTGFVKPYPFFYPTVEAHKQEIQEEILTRIREEIERI